MVDGKPHLAQVHGEIAPEKSILCRVHSECLTGDVFARRLCNMLTHTLVKRKPEKDCKNWHFIVT